LQIEKAEIAEQIVKMVESRPLPQMPAGSLRDITDVLVSLSVEIKEEFKKEMDCTKEIKKNETISIAISRFIKKFPHHFASKLNVRYQLRKSTTVSKYSECYEIAWLIFTAANKLVTGVQLDEDDSQMKADFIHLWFTPEKSF
jgi:hypothetical protein